MNIRRATILSLFLATALVFTGCFDELSGPYDGEDKIAFAFSLVADAEQDNEPAGRAVRGDTAQTISLPTELIGPQRSSSVEVSYSIAPDPVEYTRSVPTDTGEAEETSYFLTQGTTAEEGSHFQIDGSYTLPADSSSANLQVQILDADETGVSLPARVSIKLDGNPNQNLFPAERFRYYTLTLVDP